MLQIYNWNEARLVDLEMGNFFKKIRSAQSDENSGGYRENSERFTYPGTRDSTQSKR